MAWTQKVYKEKFVGNDSVDFIYDEWSGRGFKVFADGTWETSVYKNNTLNYATASCDTAAAYYEKNSSFDFFEATFDEEDQTINLHMEWGMKSFDLLLDCKIGWWTVSGNDKHVSYDGKSLYLRTEDNWNKKLIASTKDIFSVYGKVLGPARVPRPDICRHKFNGEVECIYGENRTKSDGLMIMIDKDSYKWFGECVRDKPGGYGIKITPLDDRSVFEWGMFGTNTYGRMPYESWKGGGYMCVQYSRANNSSDTSYIEIFCNHSYDRRYYEVYFTIEDGKVTFKAKTPQWDTIEIDQSFTSVRVRYANEDWKTYRI